MPGTESYWNEPHWPHSHLVCMPGTVLLKWTPLASFAPRMHARHSLIEMNPTGLICTSYACQAQSYWNEPHWPHSHLVCMPGTVLLKWTPLASFAPNVVSGIPFCKYNFNLTVIGTSTEANTSQHVKKGVKMSWIQQVLDYTDNIWQILQ